MLRPKVLLVVAAAALVASAVGVSHSQAAAPSVIVRAQIVGRVNSLSPGSLPGLAQSEYGVDVVPVEDATIQIRPSGRTAVAPVATMATGSEGTAQTGALAVSNDRNSPTLVDITVSAPGYASFTYRSMPLLPGRVPILTPTLSDVEQVDDLAAPLPAPAPNSGPSLAAPMVAQSGTSCTGYTSTTTPPAVINVYADAGDGRGWVVHTVDFVKYVEHVLPHEWLTQWDASTEALRSGAVAVKMYGRYHVLYSHSTGSGCWDVDPTQNYQVWDPNFEDQYMNQAVLDTWDYYLMNSAGTPYEALHEAGPNDGCGELHDVDQVHHPGNTLSQYGSKACADLGYSWAHILAAYYYNPVGTIVSGPHAVGSTAENLPTLEPVAKPYQDTSITISWKGLAGVTYKRCSDNSYPGAAFTSCTSLGTGISSVTTGITTSDQATKYYRIVACGSNGYCSAARAGGEEYRNVSGNQFYATISFKWTTGQAYVGARDLTWAPLQVTERLYDGAYGYGGTSKKVCSGMTFESNCGPSSWSSSQVFDSVCQTDPNGNVACAWIRALPKTDHVGGE